MMLTEVRKAIVDALTEDELAYEVKRGRESIFQKELYVYAQTRPNPPRIVAASQAVHILVNVNSDSART
jgi:hypothetical protein